MKILVIHPKDETTDFLQPIYSDINCTIVRNSIPKRELENTIRKHTRIIMLGHGMNTGLLGYYGQLVIDSEFVSLLRVKRKSIYIWCHASEFVRKYGLEGLNTGMIVSDEMEAQQYGLPESPIQIEESNTLFAKSVKDCLDYPPKEMVEGILQKYTSDTNQIIQFNRNNIFYAESDEKAELI